MMLTRARTAAAAKVKLADEQNQDNDDTGSGEDGDGEEDDEDGGAGKGPRQGDQDRITPEQLMVLKTRQAQLELKRAAQQQELDELQKSEQTDIATLERIDELRKLQVEARRQYALRSLGRCSQGFDWVKKDGGYRCCGGSHYMTDAEADRLMKQPSNV
jgi:hypothetical protein